MNSNELRDKFLNYFQQLKHQVVASSALVPEEDPSLLFTNAGMVQFKDYFLGKKTPPYLAAVSAQRCVRAGGKHNDLENVGYTARHHTFFEMLGNFSFGDYFKKEAITYAWNFLTKELNLAPEKLWVTVYVNDDEAADIWLKDIKVDPNRFSRCGENDNFWSMGDTGPCGPCTEIFYDHGPEIPGGPPGSHEADGDRYIEIWNLVFMQFNRDASGKLTPLPKPAVDTGMGLERVAAIMQNVHNNYDIDTFRHLISEVAKIAHRKDTDNTSLRVIADHIRSCAFLIVDGVTPSNEGRGYVLRRIIRRAIRHGNKLGIQEPFFYKLVPVLVAEMGQAYPELKKAEQHTQHVLHREEEQFANTLELGLKLLEQEIAKLPNNILPGEVVFKLYDTYGFPPDLTGDIAREKNLIVDFPGFEKEMTLQRQKSQDASKFSMEAGQDLQVEGETEFTGHEQLSDESTVTALFNANEAVQEIQTGQETVVILNRTPFYAEAGGQVGDCGYLYFEGGSFKVVDTKKRGLVYLHHGQIESGTLRVGMKVNAEVDSSRKAIMVNHTATHLLHSALRRIIGEHVIQKGSLVAADRLRFDFAHYEPLTSEQIYTIESLVNRQISANLSANIEFMTPDEAVKKGAVALFGEKYGKEVRVLSLGEFSMELCGGTHVNNTAEIGLFKIISETGVASGIRRVEALTAEKAFEWLCKSDADLHKIADILKIPRENIVEKLDQTLQHSRSLEKEVEKLKQQLALTRSKDLLSDIVDVDGVKVVATTLEGADSKILRDAVDNLKDQLGNGVIMLASIDQDKIILNAGVTKTCSSKIHAGELVNFVAQQVGGKGGGRPDMAQGGGAELENLDKALASVVPWVKARL
ncbi:MAG: alanine--tRNA ligase [Gammaproteobacteria bacterium]|nr:alanine--tRNA ligase [Gammaproteobacteria bacterium]